MRSFCVSRRHAVRRHASRRDTGNRAALVVPHDEEISTVVGRARIACELGGPPHRRIHTVRRRRKARLRIRGATRSDLYGSRSFGVSRFTCASAGNETTAERSDEIPTTPSTMLHTRTLHSSYYRVEPARFSIAGSHGSLRATNVRSQVNIGIECAARCTLWTTSAKRPLSSSRRR